MWSKSYEQIILTANGQTDGLTRGSFNVPVATMSLYGILFTCTNLRFEIVLKARRHVGPWHAPHYLTTKTPESLRKCTPSPKKELKSGCTDTLCSMGVAVPGIFPLYIAAKNSK